MSALCRIALAALLAPSAEGLRKQKSVDKTDPTCESQWNNMACSGQFGNEQCFTCGSRITWLIQSMGYTEEAARQQIADDFYSQCGACSTEVIDVSLSYEGYNVVWQDDFNGDAVDASKWRSVQRGDGFGNNELQFYTNRTENAWVNNGKLTIRARLEDFGGRRFTSAKLESTIDWKYGKFSCRSRLLNTATGTWAAHWMMPTESAYGGWPNSGEIDIMEHVGYDTGVFHGTVHTGAFNHLFGTEVGGSTRAAPHDWHTWTAEWRDDIILFAVDEVVYKFFRKRSDNTAEWPFDKEFYLILNYAVGGNWGAARGIDEPAFAGDGQMFEVDWCKVEQRGN